MNFEEVVGANRALLSRVRELNTRAGENIFPVPDRDELTKLFAVTLGGARCVAEIRDMSALLLPTLDEGLVAWVSSENPDTISLLGSDLAVEYRAPQYGNARAPRVVLTPEMLQANAWFNLPDDGVRLPGGRLVEVAANFGWNADFSSTDSKLLKARVREYLNRGQLDRWEKPAIELPDPSVEGSSVPFITAVYGQCVVTGEDLLAYGTVSVKGYRYSSDPWFEGGWYLAEDDARSAAEAATKKLDELKVEAKAAAERERIRLRKQEELAKAQAKAALLREQLKAFQSDTDWQNLDILRYKAEERTGCYSQVPSDLEGVLQWNAETEAMITEIKATLEGIRRRREEEILAKAEAERAWFSQFAGKTYRVRTLSGNVVSDGFGSDAHLEGGELQVDVWGRETLAVLTPDIGATPRLVSVTKEPTGSRIMLTAPCGSVNDDEEFVFVHEYCPGSGAKRWPSFHIDWDHTGPGVVKLAEAARYKGSGSDTYTLVIAPMGWAGNIASQFINERDHSGQMIAFKPGFAPKPTLAPTIENLSKVWGRAR